MPHPPQYHEKLSGQMTSGHPVPKEKKKNTKNNRKFIDLFQILFFFFTFYFNKKWNCRKKISNLKFGRNKNCSQFGLSWSVKGRKNQIILIVDQLLSIVGINLGEIFLWKCLVIQFIAQSLPSEVS